MDDNTGEMQSVFGASFGKVTCERMEGSIGASLATARRGNHTNVSFHHDAPRSEHVGGSAQRIAPEYRIECLRRSTRSE